MSRSNALALTVCFIVLFGLVFTMATPTALCQETKVQQIIKFSGRVGGHQNKYWSFVLAANSTYQNLAVNGTVNSDTYIYFYVLSSEAWKYYKNHLRSEPPSAVVSFPSSKGEHPFSFRVTTPDTYTFVFNNQGGTEIGCSLFVTITYTAPSAGAGGAIPGFPWESILVGVAIGVVVLLARRGVLRLPTLHPT